MSTRLTGGGRRDMPRVHPFRIEIEKTKTSFVSLQTDPINFVHLRYCLILAYLLGDPGQYRDPLQTDHQISRKIFPPCLDSDRWVLTMRPASGYDLRD